MKQITLHLITLLILALTTLSATAHDFEVDGIYYNINGTEATVTYGTNKYTGDITIPETVTYGGTTYPVTSIGYCAFNGCTGLTNITIPKSVTAIDDYAFRDCSGLTSITISNSVTSIGNEAFEDCSSLICVTIPNSVTSIGDWAFSGCSGLTSIIIGDSVKTIGIQAFYGCTSLTGITIPNSVTSFHLNAFEGCFGITNINVESGNPSYDSRDNCNAIIETATNTLISGCMNTTIPNSVTAIGWGAFSGCYSLTSITIPNSVTAIGGFAFDGTAWFDNQPDGLVYAGLVAYKYKGTMPAGTSITIDDGTLGIADDAFSGCSGLTSITIPNSVTSIGIQAFSGCSGLTSINIPNSVTSIGYNAFSGCSGVTSVTIPDSVTSIDESTFRGCIGLTSITIPNSVTSIGYYAFDGCSGLTSITIPKSVTHIDFRAFYGCNGLTSVTCLATMPPTISIIAFPSDVTSQATLYVPRESLTAYQAADNWKDFSEIVGIPEINDFEVDGVWYRALDENTVMVIQKPDEGDLYQGDVIIPDSVSYLGYTFSVTAIDASAFEDCYEVTSVVIGDAVETIGENAFLGCSDLTSVTIGSGVTTIGAKAFNYCNALQTVTCRGTVPPVMANANCFSNAAYSRATLLVPRQQIEAYQAADFWYRFSHIDGWGSAGMGDVNADGAIGISDVTALTNALLTNNTDPALLEYGDLNHNGRLDIGDVTSLIVILLSH